MTFSRAIQNRSKGLHSFVWPCRLRTKFKPLQSSLKPNVSLVNSNWAHLSAFLARSREKQTATCPLHVKSNKSVCAEQMHRKLSCHQVQRDAVWIHIFVWIYRHWPSSNTYIYVCTHAYRVWFAFVLEGHVQFKSMHWPRALSHK